MKFKLAFLTCALGANLTAFSAPPDAVSLVETVAIPAAEQSTPDMINLLHQREWVRLSDDGSIHGKLSVLSPAGEVEGRIGAEVVISLDGAIVLKTETDTDGAFQLDGLKPGTYALQSRGDYTFAAFALHVLPASAAHLSSDLEVYASVISAERVSELLAAGLVPGDLNVGEDLYYRNFTKDPLGGARVFNNSHQVVLQDGTLVGRVSRPGWTFAEQDLTGTVAQVVRDGEVVAKAAVGKDGFYRVEKLEPGVYDLFVSGDDGFAVMAFEAIVGDDPLAAASNASVRLVSTQLGSASNCLSCEMVYQHDAAAYSPAGNDGFAQGQMMVDEFGAPVMGGGFAGPGGFAGGGAGGGGFGGAAGGGGGGIGGLGGLMGIAGLAIGVTALANDDPGVGTQIAP